MDHLNALEIATKNLVSIEIDEPISSALKLMREKNIRHLLVQSNNKAIGVLSERDLMKGLKVEIENLYSVEVIREAADPKLTVRHLMSWPIKNVDQETPLIEVVDKMLQNKISSLIVTHNNAVVGIVTTDDLLEILKRHLNKDEASFWGEDFVNSAYSTPIRNVLEILSNTGI